MCKLFVNGSISKGLSMWAVVPVDVVLLHLELRMLMKNIRLEETNVDLLSNSLLFFLLLLLFSKEHSFLT